MKRGRPSFQEPREVSHMSKMPQQKKPIHDQPRPYIGDRKLLGRVRQYVDTRQISDPLDPMTVTLRLQKMYIEYGRKKTNSLKNSVAKALQVLLDELKDEQEDTTSHSASKKRRTQTSTRKSGEDGSGDSELTDSDFSIEDEEQPVGKYSMNDMMKEVYKKTNPESPVFSSTTPHTDKKQAKSPGFLRCRSEPIIADMAPGSSDTEQSVISRFADEHYSLPGSPRVTNAKQTKSPLVITIGDDEPTLNDIQGKTTPNKSRKHGASSSGKKSKKPKLGQTDYKEQTTPYKKKNAAAEIEAVYSTVNFSQIGGNDKTIEEIKQLLIHMRYPEIYRQLGVTSPNGFLLHGPPGCGKTLMANAIAGELELPFLKLAATELVSGVSGESEERLRKLFQKAMALSPCIVFIDEVDSITPKREQASKDMERRIVSQFLTCLDELNSNSDIRVLVIGATNRPDSLDAALRRAGRFDREICLGIPNTQARNKILRVLCKNVKLSEGFDFDGLALNTPGYVGADLSSLVREAAVIAVDRLLTEIKEKNETSADNVNTEETHPAFYIDRLPSIVEKTESNEIDNVEQTSEIINDTGNPKEETPPKHLPKHNDNWWNELPNIPDTDLQSLVINMSDFNSALRIVQPSSKREGFATVPDVTWDDIGALGAIREELQMAILAPVRYPQQFESLGLNGTAGVLLTGPPGCGKTLLAKAIANESGINFISVKGPELINMYVGESEKAVRQVFQRARNSSPCVVFFDEIDALCPRRSSSSSDSGSSSRIVNQLLTELDGLESRKHVFVMAATNRPDIIDPAILRPGRLDKTLYVGVPTLKDRIDILKTITKHCTKPPISDVSLDEIAADPRCKGYSGADLSALIREASMAAMREFIKAESSPKEIVIFQHHFQKAFSLVKPSISEKDRVYYENMASRFTSKTSMDVESENREDKTLDTP